MSYMAIEKESSEEDNSSGTNQLLNIAHGTGSTKNKKRKKLNKSQRDDE